MSRAICDDVFQDLSETEKIYRYSSAKILRLIDVVKQFKPSRTLEIELNNSLLNSPVHCKEGRSDSIDKTALSISNEENHHDLNILRNSEKTNSILSYEDNNSYCYIDSNNSPKNSAGDPLKNGLLHSKTIIPCFVCGKVNCSGSPDDSGDKKSGKEENVLSSDQSVCQTRSLNNGFPDSPKSYKISDISVSNGVTPNGISSDLPEALEFPTKTRIETVENHALSKYQISGNHDNITGKNSRWRGKGRGWRQRKGVGGHGRNSRQLIDDVDNLCGIIFVEKRFTAKILFHLFHVSVI